MRRVVITGMGVISPIGSDLATFTDNLFGGVCGIGPITRFDTADYKATLAAEVKNFDPNDFGMDKSRARRMDLFSQFAMAAAKQAVMQSRIIGTIEPERFGVYVGSGIGGMHTFSTELEKLLTRGPSRVSPFFVPMMIGNIAAGDIAIEFDAQGPCLPVVTACATSTQTIGEAFHAIMHSYADAIIAGGSEATIEPIAIAGFQNMKALSESTDPNAASLPFDKRRAGFVMGEGAGIVILEEYERAVERGANIIAEIVGYGNTCDAHHITAPHPEAVGGARAIKIALDEAKWGSSETVYINAHGTGTPMNDKLETLAIKKALGEESARKAMISSSKSMTGHMLSAAGGLECIVAALTLKENCVPPTINLHEPDPECDLNYVPNVKQAVKADIALSISLGFGGHNGVIALRRCV